MYAKKKWNNEREAYFKKRTEQLHPNADILNPLAQAILDGRVDATEIGQEAIRLAIELAGQTTHHPINLLFSPCTRTSGRITRA